MAKQDPPKQPCADCARLERKLDAFVMFLCAPHPKCQRCGLLATKFTTVVHPVMGRSEHLCCDDCEPAQAKIPGSLLEHKKIDGAEQATAANTVICEARRGS
jgi:hypothetical protein